MKIKKASPGLDQRNRLGSILGEGFVVEDFDAARPLAEQVGDGTCCWCATFRSRAK